jgi:hypothetical protein
LTTQLGPHPHQEELFHEHAALRLQKREHRCLPVKPVEDEQDALRQICQQRGAEQVLALRIQADGSA